MQKKIVLVLILLFSFAHTVNAEQLDILRGIPATATQSSYLLNEYDATDGDDTTFTQLQFRQTATFELPQVSNITSYRIMTSGSNAVAILSFLDQDKKVIHQKTGLNHATNDFEVIKMDGIKFITVRNTSGFYVNINALEVYGAEGPTTAPTNVKVEASNSEINVSWDAVSGALGYHVYVNGVKSSLINTNNYKIPSVENDRLYLFYVTAFNGFESVASKTVSAIIDTKPPQPLKLNGEALQEGGKIRISWTRSLDDDFSHYLIYKDGLVIKQEERKEALTFTITVNAGELHRYSITAVDKSGNESEHSNIVEIAANKIKDSVPPLAPLGLEGKAEQGFITLSWTANTETDLVGYYVYVNGVRYGDITSDNKLNIYGLNPNTEYRFRVAAVDDSGNISNSTNEIRIRTLQPADTTPPAAPPNLTAALAGNYLSILLSWGAVNESDVLGYYVYVSDDDLIYEQVNSIPVSTTGYSFNQIEGNKTYYFKVAAVDRSGNISEKTKSVSINVPTRDPNEQVNKKNELLVNWNEIQGAVNYLIYFNGALIATTDNQTFSFVIGEQYGYEGKPPAVVEVKAKFEDGSIGYNKNLATQSKFGFSVKDLWSTVIYIVGTLAGFLLLGIAIRFSPKVMKLIKKAIAKRRA